MNFFDAVLQAVNTLVQQNLGIFDGMGQNLFRAFATILVVWYGIKVLVASYEAGSISIKTLIIPEWWLLAPMPLAFIAVSIEFVFRMHRLAKAERAPRSDAVSAS